MQRDVFKLYPTRAQALALAEQAETHRRLYNRALANGRPPTRPSSAR